MRGVIAEGALLAGVDPVVAVLIAMWTSDALAMLILQDFVVRAPLDVAPDTRVLAFTVAIAVAGGVLFSSIAAWRSGHEDVTTWLRQSTRTASRGKHAGRWLIA